MFMYDIGIELFDSLTEEEKADIIEVDGKRYIRRLYEVLQEYPEKDFVWFCWKDKLSGQITITVTKYSMCVWAKTGYENNPVVLQEDIAVLKSGRIPADGDENPERLRIEMVYFAPAELIGSGSTK